MLEGRQSSRKAAKQAVVAPCDAGVKASRTCTPLAALVLRLPPGQLRVHTRPANDTWIAASCLARQLPLATLNLKDFADVVEHERPEIVPTQ